MAVKGNPRTFHKRWKFMVEIDGFRNSGFQSCSEIKATIAKIEYYEGGAIIPHKEASRMTVEDVTLERGATKDLEMYTWFKEVANAAAGKGAVGEDYKRDTDVVQQDRDGAELRRWELANAWPLDFVAGSWDNTADEVVINSLMLTYDYPTPT